MKALAIAATGMSAQQLNVEVIANNIANINTTAFKRARAEFSDLLYQAERLRGVPNQEGDNPVPEGAMMGLGVRTVAVRNLHRQGPLNHTTNPLDVAINGRGWFQVPTPNGEVLYTRAGAFNKAADGQIVTVDGHVLPNLEPVPERTIEISINDAGRVFAKVAGEDDLQELGRLSMATFANDAGLEPLGDNLFRETPASGTAVNGYPGEQGFGKVKQGYLEDSNVDPVREITALIAAQRAYEMNSKVISAADEMAATVSKGIR